MRSNLVWFDRVTAVIGVWLFLSPIVLPLPRGLFGAPAISLYIVGILVVLLSTSAIAWGGIWQGAARVVLAVWLAISPWLFGYADAPFTTWLQLIAAIIVGVNGLFSILQRSHQAQA